MTFNAFETLLALVKNSVGSNTFRNIYFNTDKGKIDLAENGNLSCAVFVSSVLYLLRLIRDVHITVDSTLKDLRSSGWVETKVPKTGCILVWAIKDFGPGGLHRHLGFYTGGGKAISNNPKEGFPTEHDWDEFDGRPVELILQNPALD